jgi:oligopeptidase A
MTNENPLLELADQGGLPAFHRIRPEHAEPALDAILAANRQRIEQLVGEPGTPSWEKFVAPLEDMDDRLHRGWTPASHLNAVMNSDAWRQAYNACIPKLSNYSTELGQNERLYRAYQSLAESQGFATLEAAQQKVIRDALRDFRLSGVALPEKEKQRYKDIQQQLSKLHTRFEENLLDATQAWSKHVTDEPMLAGLTESTKAQARERAVARKMGGWLLTLDLPSYLAVMMHAENRALREETYTAFATRASDLGPHAGKWDNSETMDEILALRHESAKLLGFANFAELSLARKMAGTPETVLGFLRDLAHRTRPAAQRELDELRSFAHKELGIEDLQAWDVAFASERLKRHKHQLDAEMIRQWFPLPSVLSGLFETVHRLYGIHVYPLPGVELWHPDVTAYEIRGEDNELRGRFYLDPFAREHKRSGAWMDDCAGRRRTAQGIQLPVAFLVCNFRPPVGGQPALLTHEEVLTLFHEFGHGLHHMLTRVDYAGVAGINGVPWDAVELPSQFMENWCWEREALDLFAKHWETGKRLPDDLFRRMHAARNFQSALAMLRQLEFALFDFRLHLDYDPAGHSQVRKILDEVRSEVAVLQPPAFNRFANSFAHIFAGGYAAGYYSYKWAEVLSADAYSAFEEAGVFDRTTGRRFLHTILEQGGSREAMDLFVAFRGREPNIDALLRHHGLIGEAA